MQNLFQGETMTTNSDDVNSLQEQLPEETSALPRTSTNAAEISSKPLYRFALIPRIDDKLALLAGLADPEDWSYRHTQTDKQHPILYNYLHYTFARLEEEGKVGFDENQTHSLFDTGLTTPHEQPIFMTFEENRFPDDTRKWHFRSFCHEGERDLNHFGQLPEAAHYFDDPADLILDTRLDFRPKLEHVVQDNRQRFPEPYRGMGDYQLRTFVSGAIDNAIQRVKRNYKAAVPQYYKGKVQLLLPLCLSDPRKADVALVVEKGSGFYRASTCLTLDMAYNNARQLARPDQEWLHP
jgi:hypothetical protein